MPNFMLVHDAWQGAWAWRHVVPLLEGFRQFHDIGEILVPDLPGHGKKAFLEIRRISQDDYVQAVVTPIQVRRMRDVVLVGHGFAGTFLPRAAAELGDAVRHVVFIAGRLPPAGESAFNMFPLYMRMMVKGSRPIEKGVTFPRLLFRRMLCNDMNADSAVDFLSNLVPDPFMPWSEPSTRDGFVGRFPTTYVVLTRDRSVSLKEQRRYSGSLGTPETVEMPHGHEVLLTEPQEVAELLMGIVFPDFTEADAE